MHLKYRLKFSRIIFGLSESICNMQYESFDVPDHWPRPVAVDAGVDAASGEVSLGRSVACIVSGEVSCSHFIDLLVD